MNGRGRVWPEYNASFGAFTLSRDTLRPLIRDDPWSLYEHLAELHAPIWHPMSGSFLVFGYDDVTRVLCSRSFGVESPVRNSRRGLGRTILDTDGADHDRFRRVLAPALRPSQIETYENDIVARELTPLLERIEDDTLDWHRVATELPIRIVATLLGLPIDVPVIAKQTAPLVNLIDHGRVSVDTVRRSRLALESMISDSVLTRERLPQSAALGRAVATAVKDGELTTNEAISNMVLLVLAATATTTSAIIASVAEGRSWLQRDPPALSDVQSFVRSVVRHHPPVRFTPRFALEEVEFGNVLVRRGALIQLCIASANRESRGVGATDGDPRPSLSFGRGAHSCIGAFLGEMEATVALTFLSNRYDTSSFAIASDMSPGWTLRRYSKCTIEVR